MAPLCISIDASYNEISSQKKIPYKTSWLSLCSLIDNFTSTSIKNPVHYIVHATIIISRNSEKKK